MALLTLVKKIDIGPTVIEQRYCRLGFSGGANPLILFSPERSLLSKIQHSELETPQATLASSM
jgi:hypothetical protein